MNEMKWIEPREWICDGYTIKESASGFLTAYKGSDGWPLARLATFGDLRAAQEACGIDARLREYCSDAHDELDSAASIDSLEVFRQKWLSANGLFNKMLQELSAESAQSLSFVRKLFKEIREAITTRFEDELRNVQERFANR